jgi:omega-6 fatty acid desaturase (delta-12 desaturase)
MTQTFERLTSSFVSTFRALVVRFFNHVMNRSHIHPVTRQGKALKNALQDYPSRQEIMANIPKQCFQKNTTLSMAYAALSVSMTILCLLFGYYLIPMTWLALPLWMAYAAVTGTVVTGCWVVAHECGHGAFSDSVIVRDAVGYLLHTVRTAHLLN